MYQGWIDAHTRALDSLSWIRYYSAAIQGNRS
ncbi:MAG: hypothetical protein QG626_131, partial [Patescibacteria group bacterium]|nr:hypothetical protein [Patescibacteria group bacterium]